MYTCVQPNPFIIFLLQAFFNTVFFFTGESMVRHMAAVWIYGLISFLVVYRGFWSIFNRGAALSNTQMRDLALDRRVSLQLFRQSPESTQ